MLKVIVSKAAETDLKKSCKWYEKQQPGLSDRFLIEVFYALEHIQSDPLIYQVRHKRNYRFARLHKFPFLIAYKIKGQYIVVNSVFHTSRNPNGFN